MKFKVSKRDFKNETVIYIGNCRFSNLLKSVDPFAYSAGQCGWSCDYYRFTHKGETVYISTGGNAIGKLVDTKIVTKYEELAKKTFSFSAYKEGVKKREKLIERFLSEVLK